MTERKTPPVPRRAVSRPPPSVPQKQAIADAQWQEKRAAKRKEVITEVTFESETNFYTGFTVDISAGGLFVVTWDLVPIGTKINISLTLPNVEKPISVEGQVRWVREYKNTNPDLWPGMGIQFQGLSDSARAIIDTFIESREPLYYE